MLLGCGAMSEILGAAASAQGGRGTPWFFAYGFCLFADLDVAKENTRNMKLSIVIPLLNEEPHLEREFGSQYVSYKSQVGRWLPYGSECHAAHARRNSGR